MAMNPELKAKWLEALRSGNYNQGKHHLRVGGNFCCLGVLCDLTPLAKFEMEYDEDSGEKLVWHAEFLVPNTRKSLADDLPPLPFCEAVGISANHLERLWQMNDNEGKSFPEIADYIEKNL